MFLQSSSEGGGGGCGLQQVPVPAKGKVPRISIGNGGPEARAALLGRTIEEPRCGFEGFGPSSGVSAPLHLPLHPQRVCLLWLIMK